MAGAGHVRGLSIVGNWAAADLVEPHPTSSRSSSRKCSLVCWLPWSEWCSNCTGLPRRPTAIINASTTSCEVMLECIDKPTTQRKYMSSTTAGYSQPLAVQI
jgi:hypothetical protein